MKKLKTPSLCERDIPFTSGTILPNQPFMNLDILPEAPHIVQRVKRLKKFRRCQDEVHTGTF